MFSGCSASVIIDIKFSKLTEGNKIYIIDQRVLMVVFVEQPKNFIKLM